MNFIWHRKIDIFLILIIHFLAKSNSNKPKKKKQSKKSAITTDPSTAPTASTDSAAAKKETPASPSESAENSDHKDAPTTYAPHALPTTGPTEDASSAAGKETGATLSESAKSTNTQRDINNVGEKQKDDKTSENTNNGSHEKNDNNEENQVQRQDYRVEQSKNNSPAYLPGQKRGKDEKENNDDDGKADDGEDDKKNKDKEKKNRVELSKNISPTHVPEQKSGKDAEENKDDYGKDDDGEDDEKNKDKNGENDLLQHYQEQISNIPMLIPGKAKPTAVAYSFEGVNNQNDDDHDLGGDQETNTVGSFPPVSEVVNHLRILKDLKKIVTKNDQGDYEISDQKEMKLLMESVESIDLGPIGEQSQEFKLSHDFLGDDQVDVLYANMALDNTWCWM